MNAPRIGTSIWRRFPIPGFFKHGRTHNEEGRPGCYPALSFPFISSLLQYRDRAALLAVELLWLRTARLFLAGNTCSGNRLRRLAGHNQSLDLLVATCADYFIRDQQRFAVVRTRAD